MSKIYISVIGGCVNEVLSTIKGVEIKLWDWDNIDAEIYDMKSLEKEWDKMSKKLHHVF